MESEEENPSQKKDGIEEIEENEEKEEQEDSEDMEDDGDDGEQQQEQEESNSIRDRAEILLEQIQKVNKNTSVHCIRQIIKRLFDVCSSRKLKFQNTKLISQNKTNNRLLELIKVTKCLLKD